MGDHEQLHDRKAVEKLQEIAKHQHLCMMITNLKEDPVNSRPMGVAEVDENGHFWFFTLRTSRKYIDLSGDPRVDLHFANPGDQEFLSVHGRAVFSNDRARMKKLWNPFASAWIPKGAEDPDLRLIDITPEDGYYWDTKNGKVVAGLKILAALVTRKAGDDGGVEGKVSV